MPNAVELKNVSYSYPNSRQASLNNVNFSVAKGSFVAVMGPNGAGKTTLSLCLNGLIPQLLEGELAGDVTVDNKNLRMCRVQEMAGHVGLVLDDPEAQIFGRTVIEDTSFGPANLSLPVEEIYQRAGQALQMTRLNGYEQRSTHRLSGGEKQRLAIAGILAMHPEIMVLDEPASALDPLGIREIYQTIDDLRLQKQLTIIVAEHDCQEIIGRADRVIVLKGGEIAWSGVPEELFRNVSLLQTFGIRPIPVSLIGWEFYQKGWIAFAEIPLGVIAAEKTVRDIMTKYNLRPVGKADPPVVRQPETKARALIQVSNLNYQYLPDNNVLKNINLTIRRGEFVALIGPNGSGKTTLAKHFNGLLQPSAGDVIINGVNSREFPQLARVVGYVFQNPDHQIFSATVEKELEYGLKNIGLDSAEIRRRVDRVIKFTGLEQRRKDHPFALGRGERQIIALASILALEPEILVVDEPTTGLDWAGVQKIMELIRHLHDHGTTIIMISHDMEIVARYAQRIIMMKDGSILLDGSTGEAFSNLEALEQASLVPPQIARLAARLRDLGFTADLLQEREFLQAMGRPVEVLPC